MPLKLFETIFTALNQNAKNAGLAMLLVVLISWGALGWSTASKEQEECDEERREDRKTILRMNSALAAKDDELKDVRTRLFNYFMRERETQANDSLIRKTTNRDINKVLP